MDQAEWKCPVPISVNIWNNQEMRISWIYLMSLTHKICRGNQGGFYCIIPWNVTDNPKEPCEKPVQRQHSEHPEPHGDSRAGKVGIDSGEPETAWKSVSHSAAHSPALPRDFFPLKPHSWAFSLCCGQRDGAPGLSQGTRLDTEKKPPCKSLFSSPFGIISTSANERGNKWNFTHRNEILPSHRNVLQPLSNERSSRKFGITEAKLLDACMQLIPFHLLLQILLI